MITWQLWLARQDCVDFPLPWQSPQDSLSPGRVAQSFPVIIAAIGTPAVAPKLRGNSLGHSLGSRLPPQTRYPVIKKHLSRRKKLENRLSISS